MPKYWGSQTDEDDVQVEEANGVLVDFSTLDPEAKEPIRVPPPALKSAGTARQWYLTEGPGKGKGDKLSVPRATNVKPVEEEWGGAPLKLPNQDVLEKGVRREGAIAREARKHLPGTPEYRGGAIGTRADQQVAHLDEREAGLTLPTSDQSPLDRLSTAIGGRANPILARALEDPSEKRVKFPSLEELQGVARSLSGTPEKVPSTPGEFVDTAVDTAIGQTIPGRLYQAGKKFTAASGSLPKALYEYGETLFTPRLTEATKAIGNYGVELAREGIGKVRQGINADFAADIERQRAEAKKTGRAAPYTLPDTHAQTMRQAKMFDAGAKVVENVAEGINTAHQAGAGLAEALITPTNWALMNAPGAIVKAAKRGGEVSSITGLGETSVAQRWREGAAKAGAESNAALAEAKTLKDAATSSAVKQAGLETPEAVEGAWGGIRNLLTSDVNPGLVPGKGWWDGPMRTATTKRIKAEILNMAAKTSVNEPLMHRAVGAYFTYQMAKGLPQNFERITQGGEEFFRTGDQKKLQEILPDITSAAMLFMMAKHQLWQSRGNLGGERFRTKQGIAEYRQRTRMPAYDLTDAKIQKDFVKEAFIGKRVVDHGDGLYGIRQGNSLDLARVKFVKPEDVKVEVDPATGEKKQHDAWITPPTAGAPPTIHLVAKTDMGLIKHEQTHLLTDMGALTGSLRDVERELGLEHGAIQDIPSIVKLRAELEARQKTAPPEAQKNILKQISRLDEAAKGIEAFPELVERTLGTSKTYEESIEAIYKIKNGPMPNILDVFEKAKKGDREAMAEIHDRGLGSLYTDTMILGSPEQVAKARRNQWFETAKFLLTGKKSAADVARDIAEGRFDLTGAKPPSPLYTAEEIARGKEPVVEAPPAPAPVDAVGRLREVATQNAALKKQFADMDKAKAPVADMKPVAQALDQSERDLHRAQADAVEAMKQHEKDAVAQKTDLGKRIAAIDQSTNVGKLEARELTEQADAIDKQLEELRGFMRKPASPEPPAPPPFPGSVEEKQAAAMDEAMAQETVPPPPMPERRSPTRKEFVDMPLEEVESEIRRLITDPERAESVFEVVRESRRDPLTGAKNLKAWELDAKRGENPVIVRSDHDKFKLINDNVSHAAGDQVLRDYVAAAHELGIDIYRIGGDEFRFLFKTPEDASRAMESLRDVIRRSEYDLDTPNGVARFGGVDISYGIGETDALADAAAQGQKESKPNRGPRFDQLKGKPVTSEAGDNQPGAAPAGGDAGRVYAEGRRYEDPRGVAGREASPGLGISPERFASREAQEPEQAEPYLRLKSVDILRKVVETGRLSEGAHRPGMNEGEGRKFARNKMADGMTEQQWLGYLKKRGVSEGEIDFIQLADFFDQKKDNFKIAKKDLEIARQYKSSDAALRATKRYGTGSLERGKPVLFSANEILGYLEGRLQDRKSLKPESIMDEPFDRLPGMESDPWVEGEGRSLTRRATVKEEAGRKALVYDPLPMRSRFTDFFGKRRALPQALLTRAVLEDMDVVRLSVKEDSLSEFRTLPVTAPLHPSEIEYLVKMGAKVEPKPPLGVEIVITPEVREKVRTEGQYFFASRQAQGVVDAVQKTVDDEIARAKERGGYVDDDTIMLIGDIRKNSNLSKGEFDRAFIGLLEDGTLQAHSHDRPKDMTPQEREAAVENGRGSYFLAAGFRPGKKPSGSPFPEAETPLDLPDVKFSSRQAQTPEFKKWFGDSKVVDKDGEPLVVYHGTKNGDYSVVDLSHLGEGRGNDGFFGAGFYLTSSPKDASSYSTTFRDYYPTGARVLPMFARVRKPLKLTISESEYDGSAREAVGVDGIREIAGMRGWTKKEAAIWQELERDAEYGEGDVFLPMMDKQAEISPKRFTEVLRRNGYDGVIVDRYSEKFDTEIDDFETTVDRAAEVVIFDPRQVKSATGNRGTFDPENPDIRYASRAAQLPPHLQAMADDLQRRRGIPSPRKRADLGEAAKVTNALWDEFWEGAELERITKWREHPEYRDEWDSPTLVAKDAKSAGTENLFVKGVGSGGSKIKLPTGEEVEAGPVVLNRQTGTHEFATYVDGKGKTQYVPSLKAIFSGLGESKADRLKDFRQFQHAVDLADAGIEHGTGYTRAEMQAFVDEVKKLEPDIVEKSEQLTAYYNSLLDYAVSKGAVDAGLAAALKKKWPHFSPMERLFEQETGGDGGGNKAGTGSPLRKIKGSQRPVVDEVWQAIDRTHRWISQVDRNMAAANLWRMQNAIEGTLGGIAEPAKKKYTPTTPAQGLTKEGEIVTRRAKAQGKTLSVDEANQLGALIEPRHDFDKSTSVVSVVVDGKVKELRVDGVVRDFLTALNRVPDAPSESKTVRALTALATYPTSFLKWMVTGMPAFQMAQLVRDPVTGTMQTKGRGGLARRVLAQPFTGRILPLVEIARDAGRAIGSALGKAPSIEEARFQAMYQRSAGMFSNMSAHDFETKEAVFDHVRESIAHGAKAGGVIHYLKPGQLKWGHFLDNWLDIIEKGKAPFESATRKAIARQTLKAGRNDLVAGTYARENTTNFATFGSAKWIRDANRFLPFLNAGLQSSRKFYLTMTGYDPISGKKNPKAAAEVWAKAFLWQTVPTMILWALNKGDDTIEEQRKGKNGLYYHYIRTPDIPELPEAIRGKVVAQPKAFTWATVFSTIPEAMLDALYQEKPEYLEENLIKPVRAMFGKDPHVYDAEKEVDYKPLGRVARGIGNELKAGGLSPWINAYLGLKFNVDPFYGGKIEMEYQRNMDAPLRQGYRTGQLSKDLSQGMFNVAEKVDDTKAGEAFGTNVKGAVPGPDQIAFLANQVGLRDVYNLADRAYSEGTKREMPKGDYHPIQDLAGRRRFFPPDNRATGFASEAFADIAEKADTAVSSKKQLKKTDPLMLREYIQKRDTGFATAITKLKEQIDKLQKKRAQVSQMLTEDPAKRKQTLDELTRQIRGFQRRVIILTNEREKKREPE